MENKKDVVEEVVPVNVLADEEDVKIKAFTEDGDEYAGKTREELLEELGKTGVESEEVTGKVMVDSISGEVVGSMKESDSDLDKNIQSLQDLQPENIKQYLTDMVKQNLKALIQDSFDDDEINDIISSIESKLIDLDKKTIKDMTEAALRSFYGNDMYTTIKNLNPIDHVKLAKKLLVDFKDGITQCSSMIDTMDEINKHMEFFKNINVEGIQKEIEEEINSSGETFYHDFDKYKKSLSLYIEKLESNEEYKDNKFMQEEITLAKTKLEAFTEALTFEQIFNKCKTAKEKILKDFKDVKMVNKTVTNFIGMLNADTSMSISFPMPRNLKVKAEIPTILTNVWVSFLEMVIVSTKFEQISNITSAEYYQITEVLSKGTFEEYKDEELEDSREDKPIDINQFINEIDITASDIREARSAAVAISYIIARTFKASRLKDVKQKYILSYTMNLLCQGMNPNNKSLINDLVEGIKTNLG